MKKWEFVRTKNPKAKRNRVVVHEGDLMKMTAARGGHIILRNDKIIHPNCDALVMERTPEIDAALEIINIAIDIQAIRDDSFMFSDEFDKQFSGVDKNKVREIMSRMVSDIKRKYSCLQESAE